MKCPMHGQTKYDPPLRRIRCQTLSRVMVKDTLHLQSRCFIGTGSGSTHSTNGTGPREGPLKSHSTTNWRALSPGEQIRASGADMSGIIGGARAAAEPHD
jgi:hypothetical protein